LNSDRDQKEEISNEEESTIIDSDNYCDYQILGENSKKRITGKVKLNKLDIKKAKKLANEEILNRKLNYHKKKNFYNISDNIKGFKSKNIGNSNKSLDFNFTYNINKNSGSTTAKYLKDKEEGNYKNDYENNTNLLKKFSLWKTIDDEITQNNINDMRKMIKILENVIRISRVK